EEGGGVAGTVFSLVGGWGRCLSRLSIWFVHNTGGLAIIVRLLHEEEQEDQREAQENRRKVKDPFVPQRLVDEAADHRREEVAARQHKRIHAHERRALVREEQIRHRDLGQGLDRALEEAKHDVARDPLARAPGVRAPQGEGEGRGGGHEVGEAFAEVQREGLEDEQAPAREQEHVARAGVEVGLADVQGGGEGHEDRVDEGAGDAVEPDVEAHAGQGEVFSGPAPVEGVVGGGAGGGDEDDVGLGGGGLGAVDEVDCAGGEGRVDVAGVDGGGGGGGEGGGHGGGWRGLGV
ncbi:hypothetical protein Tdes44962_MAKER09639, partial [Teratosphaeria destructans]